MDRGCAHRRHRDVVQQHLSTTRAAQRDADRRRVPAARPPHAPRQGLPGAPRTGHSRPRRARWRPPLPARAPLPPGDLDRRRQRARLGDARHPRRRRRHRNHRRAPRGDRGRSGTGRPGRRRLHLWERLRAESSRAHARHGRAEDIDRIEPRVAGLVPGPARAVCDAVLLGRRGADARGRALQRVRDRVPGAFRPAGRARPHRARARHHDARLGHDDGRGRRRGGRRRARPELARQRAAAGVDRRQPAGCVVARRPAQPRDDRDARSALPPRALRLQGHRSGVGRDPPRRRRGRVLRTGLRADGRALQAGARRGLRRRRLVPHRRPVVPRERPRVLHRTVHRHDQVGRCQRRAARGRVGPAGLPGSALRVRVRHARPRARRSGHCGRRARRRVPLRRRGDPSARARKALSAYKVPTSIHTLTVDEVPWLPSGKPDKRTLEQLVADHTRTST